MTRRHPLIYPLSGLLLVAPWAAAAEESLWRDAPPTPSAAARGAVTGPASARRVILDRDEFTRTTRRLRDGGRALTLELPLPTGGSSHFALEPSAVLPPGLASRFPELASMRGEDGQGRRVRVDLGPNGIEAAVSDPAGDWLVHPEVPAAPTSRSADQYHAIMRRTAAERRRMSEDVAAPEAGRRETAPHDPPNEARPYRVFRIAVTATPSYTQALGGTKAQALQGIATAVNRVNRIYERDFGVHFVLAEDNDKLVFTPDGPDPFGDIALDGDFDLGMAIRNVDVVSGILRDDAFDVGHLLDAQRDSGVAGAIGNTCASWTGRSEDRALAKAAGMTGNAKPFGDPFHVDFIAHELGHQFGASHTFNGCARDQWSPGTALEPGSGSTVMGYAGLCKAADLQAHSDDYFHGVNIEEVAAWLDGAGGSCAATSPAGHRPPWIDTEGWQRAMTVPARTPFQLTGVARFAEPDARLSYTFEQMDLGDFQYDPTLIDRGTGPLFRSRRPNADGTQTFPAMAVLLGTERADHGDTLPTGDRRLRFRMTVRDEREGLLWPAVFAERTVRVVDTGRAFAITAPARRATLRRGKTRTVRWDTAETTMAPIACPSVRIDLSTDGGLTFATAPLADQVPNRGKASVHIPVDTAVSDNARLRVACADGRFFAISEEVKVR